jgi:hypothetical protein
LGTDNASRAEDEDISLLGQYITNQLKFIHSKYGHTLTQLRVPRIWENRIKRSELRAYCRKISEEE